MGIDRTTTGATLMKPLIAEAVNDQYTIMQFGADEDHCKAASATSNVTLGVSQHESKIGEGVRIQMNDISPVKIGAAVVFGRKLTANSAGRAIHASTGDQSHGIAMKSGANDGDIIPMLIERSTA